MLEIELKFPVADLAALKRRLLDLGAKPSDAIDEIDHYFNAPDRNYAITDEALRIREHAFRGANGDTVITYKGPKLDTQAKTRTEIELPLEGGIERWTDLLTRLGYRPVATVRKHRQPLTLAWAGFVVQTVLDDVANVGTFAELEIVAEEKQRAPATQAIQKLARDLGLEKSERRSYLEMLLATQGREKLSTPLVVNTGADLRHAIASYRHQGQRIGFVPTMGALHEGHASLIRVAARDNECVVVSIFVNPTQFGPNEDFQCYPRTLETDLKSCAQAGAQLVFVPSVEEIYPAGPQTFVEVKELQELWDGISRPGHFRGVATVVAKLFNMVQPDVAYFGQKDAQQARIIQQMVQDLAFPITIRVCPIIREPDGLALSSRNRYLSHEDRQKATVLNHAIQRAQEMFTAGERDASKIRDGMAEVIRAVPGAALEYADLVDAQTLQRVDTVTVGNQVLIAVRIGGTRLIDNAFL